MGYRGTTYFGIEGANESLNPRDAEGLEDGGMRPRSGRRFGKVQPHDRKDTEASSLAAIRTGNRLRRLSTDTGFPVDWRCRSEDRGSIFVTTFDEDELVRAK